MKQFILSLIAMLAITASAFAQFQGDNGQRPRFNREEMIKARTEMMVKKYGLNAEQAAALLALNEKQMPMMHHPRHGQQPEKADSTAQRPRREGKKAEGMGERKDRGHRFGGQNIEAYNAELQKIMTAEQYKSYQEDMEKMRKEGPRRRQNRD